MNQLDKAISFWQFNRHLLNALGHNWLRQASQLANTHSTHTHTHSQAYTVRPGQAQHVNTFIIMNMRIFVRYVCDSDSDSYTDSVGCDCGAQWDSGTVGQWVSHGLLSNWSVLRCN